MSDIAASSSIPNDSCPPPTTSPPDSDDDDECDPTPMNDILSSPPLMLVPALSSDLNQIPKPNTAVSIQKPAGDPIKETRQLGFPEDDLVAEKRLFEGPLHRNCHEITLLNAGFFCLNLNNLNEVVWDGVYLLIGRMKVILVCEPADPSEIFTQAGDILLVRSSISTKAQQSRQSYFFNPRAGTKIKLYASTSLALGMSIKCSYDIVWCGSPVSLPLSPEKPFTRKGVNILCLDGGGVLGMSCLKTLERIELELRKLTNNDTLNITDCFDMVAGTSCGGIIALGLLSNLCVSDLVNKWGGMSERIFDGGRGLLSGVLFEGYDTARLKNVLSSHLGRKFMSCYSKPYCFVTSVNVKQNPFELFLMRNYNHTHLTKKEYRGSSSFPLWAAAWATASAPTYLRGPSSEELSKLGFRITPEIQLCDGALKANNPTMVALEEASRLCGKKLQHFIEADLGTLVSIGTGYPTLRQTTEKTSVSTLQIILNSAHLLTSATATHRDVMHWISDPSRYFRFSCPGISHIPIDCTDKDSLELIDKSTVDYLIDEKFYDLKRLVKQLALRV